MDILLLTIRPDWPKRSRAHPDHPDLAILQLQDVISHHVVGSEHLGYYRVEADKVGIKISDVVYETQWRAWSLYEMATAAVESAGLLVRHLGGIDGLGETNDEIVAWHSVAMSVLGSHSSDEHRDSTLETLISKAREIESAAAGVRGTEAFAIACCVEWVEHRVGEDAFTRQPIGALLQSAIARARLVDASRASYRSTSTEAALDLLEAAYPSAFSEEIGAVALAPLASLLVDAWTGSARPEGTYDSLRFIARRAPASLRLACVFVAAGIGPELVRQLLRSTRPKLFEVPAPRL